MWYVDVSTSRTVTEVFSGVVVGWAMEDKVFDTVRLLLATGTCWGGYFADAE